jgi:excisionase family DNA binding protein
MLEHMDERRFITTPQAAQRTGLSKNYLTQLLRSGKLDGFRLGRDWLIYTDSLDKFLATPHKPGPKGPRGAKLADHALSATENDNNSTLKKVDNSS